MLMMDQAALAATRFAARNCSPKGRLQDALAETAEHPCVRIARDGAALRRIADLHRQCLPDAPLGTCPLEPLGPTCVNVYVEDAGAITCAVEVSDLADRHDGNLDFFRRLADQLGMPRAATLTGSRLAKASRHDGRHVAELIRFIRLQAVRAGWRYCIVQTTERLIPFLRRFEFDETGLWSIDPIAGRLQVLVLDTRDQPLQGRR